MKQVTALKMQPKESNILKQLGVKDILSTDLKMIMHNFLSHGVLFVPLLSERSEVAKARTPLDRREAPSNGVLDVMAKFASQRARKF